MPESPPDPFLGEIVSIAVHLHEIFVSFRDAGFTDEQAFQLARDVLMSGLPKNPTN